MKLELTEINKILKDLLDENLEKVDTQKDNFEEELSQGEIGILTMIFKVSDETYIKITKESNSYGNDRGISSISFVKPVKKEVTIYENV